jgi:hypothetical protein
MVNSRTKGKVGEREAVQIWKQWYPNARRGSQFRDGSDNADVIGVPYWIEVKRLADVRPANYANAWIQATSAMTIACEREYIDDLQHIVVMARQDRGGWMILTTSELLYSLGFHGENYKFQHPNLVDGEDLRLVTINEWSKLMPIGDTNGV